MLQPLHRLIISVCLLLVQSAYASPQETSADLNIPTDSNSLLEQVDAARQAITSRASDLVSNALRLLGTPYKRGGVSASNGFDCSGFVQAIYEQTIGLMLPRNAAQQAASTQHIDKADLQPGDLVFFNTMRHAFSHVGIYIGDGQFVHSPKPGSQVRVEDMGLTYWKRRFDGARRVEVEPAQTSIQAVIEPKM
jgi:cell wall-associated NlpC family hydrolase